MPYRGREGSRFHLSLGFAVAARGKMVRRLRSARSARLVGGEIANESEKLVFTKAST